MPSGVPYFIHRRRGPAGEGGREGGGPLPSLRLWLGGCVDGKGRIGEGEENRRRGMLLRRCEVKNSSKMVPYVRISHLQDEEDEGANAFMKSALWREDHDEGSRKKERKKERKDLGIPGLLGSRKSGGEGEYGRSSGKTGPADLI